MRHRGGKVVAERVPARQHQLRFDPRLEQPQRGCLGDLQRGDGRVGEPLATQAVGAGAKQRANPAEIVEQPLGERLGVDLWNRQGQQIFDQFIIVKAGRSRIEQALAKPRAVPGGICFLDSTGALVHAAP